MEENPRPENLSSEPLGQSNVLQIPKDLRQTFILTQNIQNLMKIGLSRFFLLKYSWIFTAQVFDLQKCKQFFPTSVSDWVFQTWPLQSLSLIDSRKTMKLWTFCCKIFGQKKFEILGTELINWFFFMIIQKTFIDLTKSIGAQRMFRVAVKF